MERDVPELDFIRSDIDPSTVKPLDTRELIGFVNEFLLTSADLMNSFCVKFEDRIFALESRMDGFERQLILLERKLANVPMPSPSSAPNERHHHQEHAQDTAQSEVPKTGPTADDASASQQHNSTVIEPSKVNTNMQNAFVERSSKNEEKEQPSQADEQQQQREDKLTTEIGGVPAKEHPVVGKYFRMLRMGVPEPAVRQKMRAEGFEPAILDKPDALMPVVESRNPATTNSTSDSEGGLGLSSSSSASSLSSNP